MTARKPNLMARADREIRPAAREPAAEVLDTALAYLAAGFSILPVKMDGSKGPARRQWRELQERRLTEAEAGVEFAGRVGLLSSAISGVFDCARKIVYPEFLERLPVVKPEPTSEAPYRAAEILSLGGPR